MELLDEKFHFVPGEADDSQDRLIWLECFLCDVDHSERSFETGLLDDVDEVLDVSFCILEALGGESAAPGLKHFSRRRKWRICNDLE